MKLLNAFSLGMIALDSHDVVRIVVKRITLDEARGLLADGFESAVGHADTAAVFSDMLGLPVPCVRSTVSMDDDDEAVVGQYKGPRLPEGTTKLPAGATIEWLLVGVRKL